MKHRVGFNRLSRKASHRKAMLRNMVTSLFDHERITTTKAKALEVRRIAEKMITRAKVDSVHSRRIIARKIWDKAIVNKLFTEIGPRFVGRTGGYCRILKVGFRQGDAADMAILELIANEEEPSKPAKGEKKATKSKKSDKSEKAPKPETKSAVKTEAKPDAKPEVKDDTVEPEKEVETSQEPETSEPLATEPVTDGVREVKDPEAKE